MLDPASHTESSLWAVQCSTPYYVLDIMQERDQIALPLKGNVGQRETASARLNVLKRFSFEPALMRSGVIAAQHNAPAGTALLFVKGAPSKVKPLLRGSTLPHDFQEVCHQFCDHCFTLDHTTSLWVILYMHVWHEDCCNAMSQTQAAYML